MGIKVSSKNSSLKPNFLLQSMYYISISCLWFAHIWEAVFKINFILMPSNGYMLHATRNKLSLHSIYNISCMRHWDNIVIDLGKKNTKNSQNRPIPNNFLCKNQLLHLKRYAEKWVPCVQCCGILSLWFIHFFEIRLLNSSILIILFVCIERTKCSNYFSFVRHLRVHANCWQTYIGFSVLLCSLFPALLSIFTWIAMHSHFDSI